MKNGVNWTLEIEKANGDVKTYGFPPNHVAYENLGGNRVKIIAFKIGSTTYYFKDKDHAPHTAANLIKDAVSLGGGATAGGAIGRLAGSLGGVIGIIAGATVGAIANHFLFEEKKSGFYNNKTYAFKGPLTVTLS